MQEDNKKFHKELNQKIFKGNKLKPEVLNKLKNVANAFIEFLDIPTSAIKDIVLTGSNVSYNYTPQSDLDIHLIVNFEKVHKDCPIVSDFMYSKKCEFNNNHDIYIYGIPVEVYAEPIDAPSVYNGLYSIKYNKWIKEPEKLKPLNNSAEIKAKYNEIKKTIEELLDESKYLKNETAKGETAKNLMKKLKEMRMTGLSKEGEFSVENQVFKKLRNEGYIEKLVNMRKKGEDKKLSLEEKYEDVILSLKEMLCASTTAFGTLPNPVIGQSGIHKESRGSSKPAMYKYNYRKIRGNKMNTIVETMKEIYSLCEAIMNEEKYVFPKKAVEDGNNKLVKAYKDDVDARRLSKKAFSKLNKKVKELKSKGIDPDIDINPDVKYMGGSKGEYQQALKTASNLQKKQFGTSINLTKAQSNQHKLSSQGLKGVKNIKYEPVKTKKGDSHKFKATIGESIKEINNLCNKILKV